MKKILTGILTVALCAFMSLGVLACGATPPADPPPTPPTGDIEIEGVTFDNKTVTYNGSQQEIVATGIPSGVSANYSNNTLTNVGSVNASVTLSGDGYITKTLNAT